MPHPLFTGAQPRSMYATGSSRRPARTSGGGELTRAVFPPLPDRTSTAA
ncbi:hypothetical protein [Streptomyces sp. NPDC003480]